MRRNSWGRRNRRISIDFPGSRRPRLSAKLASRRGGASCRPAFGLFRKFSFGWGGGGGGTHGVANQVYILQVSAVV